MEIDFWLVLTNACLFTLIWLVQLVIYPGLLPYNEAELKEWHPKYTVRVSMLTAPLMFIQLALYGISLNEHMTGLSIIGLILVLGCWLITFVVAIPLHNKIDLEQNTLVFRKKLIQINWYRTIGWSGSLILSIISYGK